MKTQKLVIYQVRLRNGYCAIGHYWGAVEGYRLYKAPDLGIYVWAASADGARRKIAESWSARPLKLYVGGGAPGIYRYTDRDGKPGSITHENLTGKEVRS